MFDDSIDEREDEDEEELADDDDEETPGKSKKVQGPTSVNEKESLAYSDYTASLNATSLNFAFSATKSNLAALTT